MVNVNKLSAEMQKELAFTKEELAELEQAKNCLLYTSPSPRDA